MKKLIFLFFFIGFSLNAQVSTTETEYNYMLNGIRTTIENSLDVKQGYKLVPSENQNINGYNFQYIFLARTSDDVLCGVVVKCLSAWGNTYYLAMPLNNPKLMQIYNDSLDKFDAPFMIAYNKSLSTMFTIILNQYQKSLKK